MSTEDRAAWGPLIAERRAQFGWSQERLADEADVSEKTIFNLESGTNPRLSTLRKVQDALGLSSDIRVARQVVEAWSNPARPGAQVLRQMVLEHPDAMRKLAEALIHAAKPDAVPETLTLPGFDRQTVKQLSEAIFEFLASSHIPGPSLDQSESVIEIRFAGAADSQTDTARRAAQAHLAAAARDEDREKRTLADD